MASSQHNKYSVQYTSALVTLCILINAINSVLLTALIRLHIGTTFLLLSVKVANEGYLKMGLKRASCLIGRCKLLISCSNYPFCDVCNCDTTWFWLLGHVSITNLTITRFSIIFESWYCTFILTLLYFLEAFSVRGWLMHCLPSVPIIESSKIWFNINLSFGYPTWRIMALWSIKK